ncbi:MAG: PTS sugar transporter subunit IIA [Verrucomicrobiota bacterium]
MPAKISKILKSEYVKLELKSVQRIDGIREVASLLTTHPDILNFQSFYEELLARERVESTCLENGVAFPHARTDHVNNMILAVGRSAEGVWFDSSNQKVNFLFVIGTPKRMVADYLTVVGSLARLLKDSGVRQKLAEAKTSDEFLLLLAEAESKL